MALNELSQFVSIIALHVHELDAITVRPRIANHCREMYFAKSGANFQLNGVAYAEFLVRLKISSAKADGLDPSDSRLAAFDVRAQRRFKRNTRITARNNETRSGLRSVFVSGSDLSGCWTFSQ